MLPGVNPYPNPADQVVFSVQVIHMKPFIILCCLACLLEAKTTCSQSPLSKEEIYTSWNASQKENQLSNKFIKILVDSMSKNNIDTFCIYVFSYPGLITGDKGRGEPADIFLYWKEAGKTSGRYMTDKS